MLASCLDCTTTFAVHLQLCPHCGSRRKGYTSAARSAGTVETLTPRRRPRRIITRKA